MSGENSLALPSLLVLLSLLAVFALSRTSLPNLPSTPPGLAARLLVRSGPCFLPAFALASPGVTLTTSGVVLGVALAAPLLVASHREIRRGFSHAMLALLEPLWPAEKAYLFLAPLASAIAQEYLYRFALIVVVSQVMPPLAAVALSALLFVVEHRVQAHARTTWDAKDIAIHTYMSVAGGIAFVLTNTMAPAFTLHLIFNLPASIQALRRRTLSRAE